MKRIFFVFCLVIFASATSLFAGEKLTVNNFEQFEQKVLALGKKFGPENVILCFDVDCTLLKDDYMLCNDYWYEWQAQLAKSNPEAAHYKSEQFDTSLKVQHVARFLSSMTPSENDIPAILKHLYDKGFNLLVITARHPMDYPETVRELNRNKMPFALYGKFLGHGYTQELMPPAGKNFGEHPRPIVFANGVACVQGQSKGAVLLYLLKKANLENHYKAAALIDDGKHNTDDFYAALQNSNLDATTFRYSHLDKERAVFFNENKHKITAAWDKITAAFDSLFGQEWR